MSIHYTNNVYTSNSSGTYHNGYPWVQTTSQNTHVTWSGHTHSSSGILSPYQLSFDDLNAELEPAVARVSCPMCDSHPVADDDYICIECRERM